MTQLPGNKSRQIYFQVANDRCYSDKGIWALSKGILCESFYSFVQQRKR